MTYAEFRAKLEEVSAQFAQAFEEAVADITSTAQMAALEDAIARGDIQAALRAISLDATFWAPLDRTIGQVFEAGAIWQLSQMLPKSGSLTGRLQIRFDGRHQRAEAWTRQAGARLVREVSESVKDAIALTIEQGVAAGRGPRTVALDIVGRTNRATNRREGGIIGLTERQASYIVNARIELESLNPAYFQRARRDRRYDATIRKSIASGKPLSTIDVSRITARYCDKLLDYRGEVIARTEALTALNAGRYESILQIPEGGDIPAEAVFLEWQSTPDSRTRDSHKAMSRQRVKLGQPFTTPEGHQMTFPGDTSLGAPASETIQCRCGFTSRVDWAAVAQAAE